MNSPVMEVFPVGLEAVAEERRNVAETIIELARRDEDKLPSAEELSTVANTYIASVGAVCGTIATEAAGRDLGKRIDQTKWTRAYSIGAEVSCATAEEENDKLWAEIVEHFDCPEPVQPETEDTSWMRRVVNAMRRITKKDAVTVEYPNKPKINQEAILQKWDSALRGMAHHGEKAWTKPNDLAETAISSLEAALPWELRQQVAATRTLIQEQQAV
jgi:hypothetical protein